MEAEHLAIDLVNKLNYNKLTYNLVYKLKQVLSLVLDVGRETPHYIFLNEEGNTNWTKELKSCLLL